MQNLQELWYFISANYVLVLSNMNTSRQVKSVEAEWIHLLGFGSNYNQILSCFRLEGVSMCDKMFG